MEVLDFSWLSYFLAIFGFLLVYVVVYAILTKTKILGENAFINSITAFILAIVFITFSPGVQYLGAITPWFAILVVSLFFFLVIVGFSQKEIDKFMKPWIAWVFIAILLIIFVIAAIKVFNPVLAPYLPGGSGDADPTLLKVAKFAYSDRFLGGALLLIIALIVSWIVTKKAK